MSDKKVMKKRKTSKTTLKLLIGAVSFVVLVFSVFLIFKSLGTYVSEYKPIHYFYNIDNKLDYKVYLVDNNFIKQEYMGKNEMYISELIDHIDIDFSYLFSGSKREKINYSYEVVATIYGEYQTTEEEANNQVWRKRYEIVPISVQSGYLNNFDISNVVTIDFHKFNNEVIDFKRSLNLALDAYLNVKIVINNEINEENVKKITEYEVNIPLDKVAFNISTKYNKNETDTIYDNFNKGEINYVELTIGIVFGFISALSFTLVLFNILKKNKKNKYNVQVNKLLKDYGDVIVEIASPIDISGFVVVDVKDFNEMIDLHEEIMLPILHYETIENQECWFVILKDNVLYRYIISIDTLLF